MDRVTKDFSSLNLEGEEQDSPNDQQISAEGPPEDRRDDQGDKKRDDAEEQHAVGYEQNLSLCSDIKKSNNEEKTNQSDSRSVKIGCLNLWSINNKRSKVCELIKQKNLDVFLPTETWLKRNTGSAVLRESLPNNYSFFHWAREGRGGGVAVTYTKTLKSRKIRLIDATTFEYVAAELKHSEWGKPLLIINVYHKKERKDSDFKNFLEELENLLFEAYRTNTSFLLTGDFNVWVDDKTEKTARWFLEVLEKNGLSQYVKESTQRHGHTLDLVIGMNVEISELKVDNDHISDHYTIYFYAHPLQSEGENESRNSDDEQTKQQNKRTKEKNEE